MASLSHPPTTAALRSVIVVVKSSEVKGLVRVMK